LLRGGRSRDRHQGNCAEERELLHEVSYKSTLRAAAPRGKAREKPGRW
jgi:hypothetical protein